MVSGVVVRLWCVFFIASYGARTVTDSKTIRVLNRRRGEARPWSLIRIAHNIINDECVADRAVIRLSSQRRVTPATYSCGRRRKRPATGYRTTALEEG